MTIIVNPHAPACVLGNVYSYEESRASCRRCSRRVLTHEEAVQYNRVCKGCEEELVQKWKESGLRISFNEYEELVEITERLAK